MFFQFPDGGNVHGRGEGVVGTLGHVHMVVGVEQGFPGHFIAPVGDHFVYVHVALGTAAGLPYRQGEIPVQFPLEDFITDLPDGLAALFVQFFQGLVGLGRAFLQIGKGPDHFRGHFFRTDPEILDAPF